MCSNPIDNNRQQKKAQPVDELIESSCCGMAGSFGLEKEHADISMQMAEDALLPAIRNQPKAKILANGFSCRHQIKEGADRHAMHISVLLDEALVT